MTDFEFTPYVHDLEFAQGLETALNSAGLDTSVYDIVRHGSFVSILKNYLGLKPIVFFNFIQKIGVFTHFYMGVVSRKIFFKIYSLFL